MSSEANCLYVSSRGIMKSCDVFPPNPSSSIRHCYSYPWDTLKPGAIIYINSSAIANFFYSSDGWAKVKVPIVLVSGDCDETVPTDILGQFSLVAFLNDERLIAWFAQNADASKHPKLHQIPIGLDYHTLSVNDKHPWGPKQTPADQEKIIGLLAKRKPFEERILAAHANFHFSMNTRYANDRRDAVQNLCPSVVHYEKEPAVRFVTWVNQSQFQFVISPQGGGVDCHRTWEALCLGAIPIVKSSFLDSLYQGLPVIAITSWSDVTLEALNEIVKDILPKLQQQPLPKLLLSYWMNKIKEVRDAHLATLPVLTEQ